MDYSIILQAIKNEMVPSMGCTEPVALGLAVSRTCAMLSNPATHVEMLISSNIFKNAYCVQIPNTGTYGIELSCALGHLLSKPDNTMEIFAAIQPAQVAEAQKLVADGFISLKVLQSSQFYIKCTATNETEAVTTITENSHDNMIFSEKDGIVTFEAEKVDAKTDTSFDITNYTFADFYAWANDVDASELAFIKEGIEMNMKIAEIGLQKKYAMGVGSGISALVQNGLLPDDVVTSIKRTIAAASDFRMSGGNGSVMTYLGSGNQGITTMLPMAVFAKCKNINEEKLLRAEFLGMLITMYMKRHVGRLSPICGATLASSGGAAGMVYMMDGSFHQITGAVQNMMGGVAGMFCDGAKGGCALKLAICGGEAVYAAYLSLGNNIIDPTDGIIYDTVEETTKALAKLSSEALGGLDMKVIEIMQNK